MLKLLGKCDYIKVGHLRKCVNVPLLLILQHVSAGIIVAKLLRKVPMTTLAEPPPPHHHHHHNNIQ